MATYLSFWGLVLGGLGAAGVHYIFISPLLGLYTVMAGLLLLLLGLILGILQSVRYGRAEIPYLALVAGTVALGAAGYIGFRATMSPVSDLSTDTKNPPIFLGPLYTVDAKGPKGEPDPAFLWPREYDPAQGPRQQSRYPQLAPLILQGAPEKLYPAAAQALKGLPEPWRVTYEDQSKFHIELERKNPVSHFVDDIIVELRPLRAREGSVSMSSTVEFRSRARWALRGGAVFGDFTTDFGTGYRRLQFLRGLVEAGTKAAEQGEINARKNPPPVSAPQIPAASPNPQAKPAVTLPKAAPAKPVPALPAKPVPPPGPAAAPKKK